ncbi:hypothetical protein BURKHO8Y_20092 [Burkholderia sp. 8Y]|nr:hypothetical protein BURKHO8Y_20092 [Burkholderia sp. 8Y]
MPMNDIVIAVPTLARINMGFRRTYPRTVLEAAPRSAATKLPPNATRNQTAHLTATGEAARTAAARS